MIFIIGVGVSFLKVAIHHFIYFSKFYLLITELHKTPNMLPTECGSYRILLNLESYQIYNELFFGRRWG